MPIHNFLLLAILLFLGGCSSKESTPKGGVSGVAEDLLGQTIQLADYVSAKPAKLLSTRSFIEIEFKRPMVPTHLVGVDLGESPVTFEPAIAGKATWVSTSLLRIHPSEGLPAGKTVQGKLVGARAFGSGVQSDDFTFSFQVAAQEILDVTGDFAPVTGKVNQAQLVLELRFSQPVDTTQLRKNLALRENRSRVSFTMSLDGSKERVRLVSEPIARLDKSRSVTLEVDSRYSVEGEAYEPRFLLAAKGVFQVVAQSEQSDPNSSERTWEFRFSDPIASDRDLSGFVRVEPDLNVKVVVRGRSLRVRGAFTPGEVYTIRITEGLPSAYGTKMPEKFIKEVFFSNEKPKLEWVSEGIYMPLENQGKIQFRTMNLKAAQLSIQEVLPQNLVFFLQNNDLRTRNNEEDDGEGYWWSGSYQDVERTAKEMYNKQIDLPQAARNQWHKVEMNLSEYFKGKPGSAYIVKLSFDRESLIGSCYTDIDESQPGALYYPDESYYGNPCQSGYYYGRGEKERLFILSSIGLTAKVAAEGVHVWATDVASAEPLSGLKLELLSRLNESLASQKTGKDGHVFFEGEVAQKGFAVRGTHSRGFALIKLNGTNWETSRFETDGVVTQGKELRFFGYTDRGVYRPGDTVHFAGIVRSGVQAPSQLLNMNVVVRDPQGTEMAAFDAVATPVGLVSFEIPTRLSDPTGTWTAEVKTGGQTWYQGLRIETVKPNRLKNGMELPERLTVKDKSLQVPFQSKYLFGTPAAGLKARIEMQVMARSMNFKRFPEFSFVNPLQRFSEIRSTVFQGTLDEDGKAQIAESLPDLSSVPQAATLRFQATVYEKGGDYTESWHSVPVDPFEVWVGIQHRDHWYSVRTQDTLRLPVVTVDSKGRAVAGRTLKVRVFQNKRYSWWEGSRQHRWDFRTQEQTYLIHESEIRSAAAPIEFKWVPEDDAQLFIEVTDVQGGHSAGQYVYASRWGYRGGSRKVPEASHLALQTSAKQYSVGEKLHVFFKAPEGARALISLEQNGKVLDSRWIRTVEGHNQVEFAVNAQMVPNVYAVVSLILPHAQAQGERPMRLYGIQSVGVENPETRLPLQVKAPVEVRPGEAFTLEVQNKSSEMASYTLAIVDEGLLDLTGFHTPDPWNHFFRKMALNLLTLDNLDEVVGALQPDMDAYLSVGGDDEMEQRRGHPKVQRFKAVALFSGVKNVAAGKTAKLEFQMPHYVGSVRIMLVGVSQKGFVSTDTVMAVRQPLMILPTLPRVGRPGDQFDIPVSVFAMDHQVKKATVSLELPPELVAVGPVTQEVSFTKPSEKDVRFSVRVAEKLGAAKVVVKASGSGHQTAETIELPIMSASAYITDVVDTLANAGEELQISVVPFGMGQTHKATLVLSSMPSLRVDERLNYLLRYPYGCLEQTVSSVFPQLYLESFIELSSQRKTEVSQNIQAGIERLRSFALEKGFLYWPENSYSSHRNADAWSTSYAGHFMLEAKRLGYAVPQSLIDSWLKWEQDMAGSVSPGNHRYQTYRLYLLALAGKPDMGAMDLLRENHLGSMDLLSKHLLAGAYHQAGQKNVAEQVLAFGGTTLMDYRELSGTYGSSLRDLALNAWVLQQMGQKVAAQRTFAALAKAFNEQSWWSTQESAFTLLAFAALSSQESSSDVEVEYGTVGGALQKKVVGQRALRVDLTAQGAHTVLVRPLNGMVFAELHTEGLPVEDRVETEEKGLILQRGFYDDQGRPIQVGVVQQSTPFWVVLRVKNATSQRLDNLALTSLFPAGFDIVNERLSQDSGPAWLRQLQRKSVDYTDIRDDRINWFFSLRAEQTMDFVVQVQPSYTGDFRWPGLVVESMYSPEFYGRLKGGRVQVR